MYRTIPGYKRASKYQILRAIELFAMLPTAFSCTCVPCYYCKDTRTIVRTWHKIEKGYEGLNPFPRKIKTPYCQGCARPKINTKGEYYGLRHTKFCESMGEDMFDTCVPELWLELAKAEVKKWRIKEWLKKVFKKRLTRER